MIQMMKMKMMMMAMAMTMTVTNKELLTLFLMTLLLTLFLMTLRQSHPPLYTSFRCNVVTDEVGTSPGPKEA